MTAQLEQILNYLDREGVTEVILAAGLPMQFRRSGALVAITAAQLTRVQVAALVAGTPLAALLGHKSTVDLQHGRRALRIAATGTPESPALSISKQPPAPVVKPAPAVAPIVTERARRPSRLMRSERAKTPSSPPPARTRGSTKAPPATTPTPDAARELRSATKPDPVPPEPAPKANRLTKSDIKFKTPSPRSRDPHDSLPLDLDPSSGPELDPPKIDLAARSASPLSLDLDDSDGGIQLGPGGHHGSTPAIDRAFSGPSSPHAGSTPAIDRAFAGPSSPHAGSTPAIDRAFSGPSSPHAGSTPAIDATFSGRSRPESDLEIEIDVGTNRAGVDLGLPLGPREREAAWSLQGSTPLLEDRGTGPIQKPENLAAFEEAFGAPPDLDSLGPRVSTTRPPQPGYPPPAAARLAMQPSPPPASALPAMPASPPPASVLSATPAIAPRTSASLPAGLRALLQEATRKRASDLHVIVNRPACARVLGDLVPLRSEVMTAADVEALLLPVLDERGRAQLSSSGYSDLAIEMPGGGRLRTNISRCQGGLRGTFRIARAVPPTLDDLGLPKELAKVVAHHQGLVVIAGPSGHGKTTTLAALVDLVNSASAFHIITVEDPIEIVYPRKAAVVSQREVGAHTRSFAAALKGSLREDPDVIVIGELRDRETVEIALTAAETGHLVLATMSTPSAAKTIDRLVDMFPPDDQSQVRASIAGALRAIVSQRLLPATTGGVAAAVELLTGVLPLATMIRDDKLFQLPSLMQRGRAFGMIRLDDSLADLVRSSKITSEVALANAENRKELAVRLSQGTAAIPTMRKS